MRYIFLILGLNLFVSLCLAQKLHHRDQPLPCLNKTFTIHAHVVLDSTRVSRVNEEDLEKVLEEVNVAFDPICAQFKLCRLDSIDNYNYQRFTLGDQVFEEMRSRNHVENRINLYIVAEIMDSWCGFAGVGNIGNPKDASVVVACLDGPTLIHELGHLFGLLHPFHGNREELVDGSNCRTAGDLICDTPADPYQVGDDASAYVRGCEFVSLLTDANGDFYQPLVGNYMAYYPSECGCGFTYEQYLLMANTYLNSNPKIW